MRKHACEHGPCRTRGGLSIASFHMFEEGDIMRRAVHDGRAGMTTIVEFYMTQISYNLSLSCSLAVDQSLN